LKLLVFRYGRKRNKKTNIKINIERFLFLAFICTFITLVIVQVALMSPSIRTFLNVSNDYEGRPLGLEEFLYKEGEIAIGLVNGDSNPGLKVLINGDEVSQFDEKIINLKVKDGDVIEIDGSAVRGEAETEIVSKSDNIDVDCLGKTVKVQSNIKKLVKVIID